MTGDMLQPSLEKGKKNEWENERGFFAYGVEYCYRVIRVRQDIESEVLVMLITFYECEVRFDISERNIIKCAYFIYF